MSVNGHIGPRCLLQPDLQIRIGEIELGEVLPTCKQGKNLIGVREWTRFPLQTGIHRDFIVTAKPDVAISFRHGNHRCCSVAGAHFLDDAFVFKAVELLPQSILECERNWTRFTEDQFGILAQTEGGFEVGQSSKLLSPRTSAGSLAVGPGHGLGLLNQLSSSSDVPVEASLGPVR